MSHEIRTPMNGILGFSDLLDEPDLTDAEREEYISIIQSSGNQLMRIIDNILEISRLGTKQVTVINTEVSLNDLLLKQFSIFNIKKNKISLYLKKGLSDKESMILTDETKLNKIVSNLLENALKFTAEGFIEFGYELKSHIKPMELEIYVKDTGLGIKPENQEMIFNKFSQEEKELSRKVGGLGLGLSIARENAELLGGKIKVKSAKGKGATFFLTIPYKPVISEAKTNNLNNEKNEIKNEINKYTILIAEDEIINYMYLEALLQKNIKLKYTILHAVNGEEAVKMCRENSMIDFVLMDLKMPIMNGFEATSHIKKFRPDLPIVAQTAYTAKEEREAAISAGCVDFISKPINKETLKKNLMTYS